ncbi:hypothetical protein BC567DRAFT_95510 [Phyllosticta citribraziliensis]
MLLPTWIYRLRRVFGGNAACLPDALGQSTLERRKSVSSTTPRGQKCKTREVHLRSWLAVAIFCGRMTLAALAFQGDLDPPSPRL